MDVSNMALPTPIPLVDSARREVSAQDDNLLHESTNSSETGTLVNTTRDRTPPQSSRDADVSYFGEDGHELVKRLSRRATQHSSLHPGQTDPNGQDFELRAFLKKLMRERSEAGLTEQALLGVVFENLTVKGMGSGVALNKSFGSVLAAPAMAVFNLLRGKRAKVPEKAIIRDFTGSVKPGEMLLVLGRPGAGCSTFLKAITNYHGGFTAVEGDLSFEGIKQKDMTERYGGYCAYLGEEDEHFPQITVAQTLVFVAETRAPSAKMRLPNESRQDYANLYRDVLASILGLRHTYNTKVGNSYVRGVSGGERKRVSIAESLAVGAPIVAHDNSTRGLDASTALEYGRALRTATDLANTTTILSIYQCGEQLYELFDKVAVVHSGRLIYFGPRDQARQYFVDLGYKPANRQTTPDFLVSVTDVHARAFDKSFDLKSIPKTADEMAKAFIASKIGKATASGVKEYEADHEKSGRREHLTEVARQTKAGRASKKNNYNISYLTQVRLSLRRRAQLEKGDQATTYIKTGANIFQALIIGSAFYRLPVNTANFFGRGGVLFFAILFNAFQASAEITSMFAQRPIIQRHKRFAMVRPSADALGQMVTELPGKLVVVLAFDIILYFMAGLSTDLASQFFIFVLFTVLSTLGMIAVFRAIGAWARAESIATAFGGILILVIAIYTGFTIPRPSMVVWFRWLSYASPVPFAFEAVITNEFRTLSASCSTFVPTGAGYAGITNANRACTIAGFDANTGLVSGPAYLEAQYGYKYSHTWRNLGFIMAYYIFFMIVFVIGTERQKDVHAAGGVLVFKRGREPKTVKDALAGGQAIDEENLAGVDPTAVEEDNPEAEQAQDAVIKMHDVVTWKNVCYDVQIKGDTRRLLDNVNGYVKPGAMTALMGESGAGKTTLLNVLAQRVNTGVITGDFRVNGKPLPKAFQRQTAYCQQEDVHLPTSTVREALIFSAMLRQPSTVFKAEKLAYVEEVIKMLEMESFAECLVGEVGEGLNVEQRKRLTIGVELAAKPQLLIFLDEPTSGLDSQSAWSIMRFLRRLSQNGLSILCTIHQPSSELFQCFDRLLLLKRGGQIVYQGPLGENSRTMIDYFEARCDQKCGDDANPAEYILDVIGAGAGQTSKLDWHDLWLESPEAKTLGTEVDQYERDLKDHATAAEDANDSDKRYAASTMQQYMAVQKRVFIDYWRDPTYIGSRFAVNVAAGLFIGFSFWRLSASVADLQNKLFAVFLALVICTSLAQQLQPKYIQLRGLYDTREKPSRMYGWMIQPLTSLVVELPWNMLSGTVFFFCYYFTVYYPNSKYGALRGFYFWITLMVFELYFSSFAMAIAAIAPDATAASILFSTLFSFVLIFCGVFVPAPNLPYFWRSWMYPLSPFNYLVGGLLSNVVGHLPVRCENNEYSIIEPTTGSCQSYMASYISASGGYLANPDATTGCQFCPYENGDQFLNTLQVKYSDKWRNFGILIAYCAFNILLILGCTYLFREAKFGLPSFGGKKSKKADKPALLQNDPKENEKRGETGKSSVKAAAMEKGGQAAPPGNFLGSATNGTGKDIGQQV